jgi:hypothetical protein
MKRLAIALGTGAALVLLGIAVLEIAGNSLAMNSLKWACSIVLAPGVFVGIIASGGRIDDVNMWVADLANVIFYAGLVYAVPFAVSELKSKP